jgi:predicted permease
MSRRGNPGAGQRWAERLFRAALWAHPSRFRAEYGEELMQCFRDAWQAEARGRGLRERTAVLARLVWGSVRSGLAQRFAGNDADASRGRGGWSQDFRYAMRAVRRQPGFVLGVVVTLALGLGANAAVFAVVRSVVLAPLPYDQPDRLIRLYQSEKDKREYGFLTQPAFVNYRRDATAFAQFAALFDYNPEGADVTGHGAPVRARVQRVSAEYFDVLGVQLEAGRTFGREDERQDARVVVATRSVARRYAGSDTAGALVRLDGEAWTLIGILPDGFEDPLNGAIDFYVPLELPEGGWPSWQWDNHWITVIGRLAPGIGLETAQREVDRLSAVQGQLEPTALRKAAWVVSLHEDRVGSARVLLSMLMAAVIVLLVLACVNIAGLSVARGIAREHELAVRAALGSPRRRIVRQLLFESLILAGLGGVAGLLVARALIPALLNLAPAEIVRGGDVPFDPVFFASGMLTAVLCGVLFGVAPALHFSRPGLEAVLREGGRGSDGGRGARRARNVLVVVEFALALVLLAGAGLLLESFRRLQRVDLYIRPERVLAFELSLPLSRYGDATSRSQFHEEFHRRVRELPGVRGAGAINALPVTGSTLSWGVLHPDGQETQANQRIVAGNGLEVLGVPVLRGRGFGPEDTPETPRRAIINESLARELFPDSEPVGAQLSISGSFQVEIIGIAADVPIDARGKVVNMVYHSYEQYAPFRNWAMTQIVSLDGSADAFLAAARETLASLDPDLVIYDARPLTTVLSAGVARERFALALTGAFASLAMLLAAIGIYGVLAHSVNRRSREIGIRMALGARASQVRSLVLRQALMLAAAGAGFGLMGALIFGRSMASLVFQVRVSEPWILALACATLTLIALAASWLPSHRATRVDPARACL